ncbi:AGZA family xanthine/uracil permease-like MFS transporter [Endobacter medicaginis]|uniref:AGZA family xanthine/uracil permease-like MFS transporter n=1 Tax=Endobacter medicaginis TaxID=1181271 RepID=A0A839UZX4_9PROT|nr:NCS2 family permease [Endobacter medicaginis]MBB3174165.1 AGZA family xanthine/uracil permease-like MFS transporter [Endobacter medicaginis]MCX5474209.1 NCS2 family permease [Endobacter medicaginis]NVN31570.1 NCS2 family permease [Endobacter medicaginis]
MVRREILAGITSFATMSFILVVNPAVMSVAGMDRADLVMATALAATIGTLLVGLASNRPLVAAPAMGSNVVFASVMVGQLGIPWQAGLAMVILTGALFLALSLSDLRRKVMQAVPDSLRIGIQSGIGLLIIFVALRGSGVIRAAPGTLVTLGSLTDPAVLLTLCGIGLTTALIIRGIRGALMISIAVLTAFALVLHHPDGRAIAALPARLVAWPHFPSSIALHADFAWVFTHFALCAPVMIYFFCSEFFSTLGTLITVTEGTGLAADHATVRRIFTADATATIIGPVLGTSVVTIFVESLAGIEAGGRTGLTAVTAAALFALSLFFWPLLIAVPAQATAPAMIAVGLLMLGALRRLRFDDPDQALPALLTAIGAGFTANLINGMALGTFAHLLIETLRGRIRHTSPILWGAAAVFISYYVVISRLH